MSDLKKELIKLGSTNPELRPHIREVLASKNQTTQNLHEEWLEECALQAEKVLVRHPNKYVIDNLQQLARTKVWFASTARETRGHEIIVLLGLKGDVQKPVLEMSVKPLSDETYVYTIPLLGMTPARVGAEMAKIISKLH